MSSCLSGGGRTYGFDLDIVKSPSPSTRSSSPSSTLSEASNSPRTLSAKRARTPRKRPNQTYTEAAALLSTIYPKVFSAKNPGRICRHRRSHDSFATEPSELLPSFPALSDAAFLIRDPPSEPPSSFNLVPKPANSLDKACWSPPSNGFQQPGSPGPLEEDFDAKSILDEDVGGGIDSIMGNLSMDSNAEFPIRCGTTHHVNPHLRSLMGFGLSGRFELGFGVGLRCNLRRALRNADDGDWWRSTTVAMRDIVPKLKALPPPSQSEKKKKKKKKKVEKEEVKELPSTATTTTTTTISSIEELRSSLLLKLNHEVVLKEWSDRGSPYAASDASGSPESTSDVLARLSEIDLFPEGTGVGAGGIREASVMRYKEKRRTRLFSKKIRYQVRKVNADRRPRMKASGRFVKRPSSLLREAIEQENL